MSDVKRREFISLLGATTSWPLAALAQQTAPAVSLVYDATPSDESHPASKFGSRPNKL